MKAMAATGQPASLPPCNRPPASAPPSNRPPLCTRVSLQVINRGGELISPFQVEESCTHPKIVQCMAFAAPHKELGEVVGLAVPRGSEVGSDGDSNLP